MVINWIVVFLLLAIVAAIFGFGGLAGTFAGVAEFLAAIFIILFIAALIYSIITKRKVTPPL